MPAPTIAEYLKFANLQMAAESLFGFNATLSGPNLVPGRISTDPIDPLRLQQGNLHASKFTAIEAAKFVDPVTGWKVVEHISNTATGFSGTLFKNNQSGELVLSFRSTEFVNDAARDSEATNLLEIKEKGWAFGQLSDMETWYQSLKSRNLIDGQLSVTGYSLGGHLATAFNLMHGTDTLGPSMPMLIKQVVTFNGAGVGSIGGGTTTDIDRLLPMVQSFNGLRAEAEDTGLGRLMQSEAGRAAYRMLKLAIYANGGVPSKAVRDSLAAQFIGTPITASVAADWVLLENALTRALSVYNEAHRAPGLPSGGNPPNPANIRDTYTDTQGITWLAIAGESLDYQLAVLVTARDYRTSSRTLLQGAEAAIGPKVSGPFGLTNQFDVVGTEMGTPVVYDMVSHSQYHYGQEVQFFIEDQPLTRGLSTKDEFDKVAQALGARLLTDNYVYNDFGDTHSLVLLVDSLSVMNVIDMLGGGVAPETFSAIFKAATAQKAERVTGTQGKAEGDALEMVVDALASILTGQDPRLRDGPSKVEGQPVFDLNVGNTWHEVGKLREPFYKALAELTSGLTSVYSKLAGKLRFLPISAEGSMARTDFAQFLSLYYLAPFQLNAADTNATAYLKQANETLAQAWDADAALSTEDLAAGKANFSDRWLADRAKMAAWLAIGNTANAEVVGRSDVTGAWDFADAGTGKKVGVRQLDVSFSDIERHKVLFGSDTSNSKTGGADVLTGNAQEDYLYGMAGSDVLQGKQGNDYLEGGTDADILIGGTGNDIVNGGQGLDSYVWTSTPGLFGTNDGDDILIDADKRGRILINGSGVKLLVKQDATTWTTPDNKVTLAESDGRWKLTIDGGGSLDLGASFTDGDYGIFRSEEATGGTIIRGDLKPIDHDLTTPEENLEYDSLGNVKVSTAEAPGREDRLYGSDNADTLLGLESNDIINGKGGNDLMEGGTGSDILIGDVGDDTIYGLSGPAGSTPLATALASGDTDANLDARGDWVDGQSGDDILVGTAAKDLLTGGTDNDLLIGGAGNDLLLGDVALATGELDWSVARTVEHNTQTNTDLYRWTITQGTTTQSDSVGGTDVLYGGKGEDWLLGGAGDDLLDGGADADVLFGEAGNDVILGGSGADIINGDSASLPENLQGSDWIDGGDGADRIWGMAGDDIIIGGKGDDYIVGGKGRDTYIYNKGDGIDEIWDDDSGNEKSILIFGEGVDKDAIKLRKGSLLLDLGDGDAIHIENFDAANPLDTQSFASFQFADGTSLTWSELLAWGFDLDGTEGDDTLIGTGIADRMSGLGGNDLIFGLDGNDFITGGTGTDGMNGGLGDDAYLLAAGDSPLRAQADGTWAVEVIDETAANGGGGFDALSFDGSIDPAKLVVTAGVDGLLLIDYGLPGAVLPVIGGDAAPQVNRIALINGQAGIVERFEVGGEVLDYAGFVGEFGVGLYSGIDDAGRHHVAGGRGDDLIEVAEDNAVVSGGWGSDAVTLAGRDARFTVGYRDGADRLAVSGTQATLRFADRTAEDIGARRQGADVVLGDEGNSVTLAGWLADEGLATLDGRGVQTIEFADGARWDGAALRARLLAGTDADDQIDGFAMDDAIDGGDGSDVLDGRGGADTLSGGEGNDALIGGAGADTLAGGGGSDIYVFGQGSGADTVIDGGAETNVLRFGAWLSASDLRATREGDDLRLAVRGTADSALVKGYYVDTQGEPLAQSWTVDFAGERAVTLESIIAQPDGAAADAMAALARTARLKIVADQLQWVRQNWSGGARQLDPDSLSFELPGDTVWGLYTHEVAKSLIYGADGQAMEIVSSHTESTLDWGGGQYPARNFLNYQTRRIDSDEATILSDDIERSTTNWNYGPVHISWAGPPTQEHESWSWGNTSYEVDRYAISGHIAGYGESTGIPTGGYEMFPSTVNVDYAEVTRWVPLLADIVGGDADNEIFALSAATEFVDGGAGNDTIHGGTGAMGQGDLLYGNAGDDTIVGNGSVLVGGDGSDDLSGGDGADRFVSLVADETGIDRIEDRGVTGEVDFKGWYYRHQGILNVHLSERYAGQWYSSYAGDGGMPFDTRAEIEDWWNNRDEYLLEEFPDNDVVFGKGGDDTAEDSWRLVDRRESRRWRHGEAGLRAANNNEWRRTA